MTRFPEWWVAPPFDGPPTGGTIYNARLAAVLRQRGIGCERVDVGTALGALLSGQEAGFWVDSLYLDALPELALANVASRPLRLVVHYLPSLVEERAVHAASDLTSAERAALAVADGFLATSDWVAGVLERLGVPRSRVIVVEPGVDVPVDAAVARTTDPVAISEARPLRVSIVANVVPGKGIEPFLSALSRARSFHFALAIVGSVVHDEAYAAACERIVSAEPELRGRVRFVGSVEHGDALDWIARSDVLVSPSRMESFGMALAEARALGVPVLARRSGNTGALVEEAAGGSLFDDDDALVAALATIASSPDALVHRSGRALAAIRRRTWDDAAADFVRLLGYT